MKSRSSKRAKALQPSQSVKDAVWERDGHRCVICNSRYAFPEAHYIPRSKGGLGIEKNIVTLCRICHDDYDNGKREIRQIRREQIRRYLMLCYEDWDEKDLIYRKD